MTCFYQTNALWQTVLLVVSQFTVIFFAAILILLFKRKSKIFRQSATAAVLVINMALYVIMQLDSRLTGAEQAVHLHVPYVVLMAITLLSLGYGTWVTLRETKNRTTIRPGSIKEAFDNLPAGVCFFNEAGLPVLCNLAMQRFSFAVCGKDVQFITDLEECKAEDFVPVAPVKKDGRVFVLADGSAWHLKKRVFTHESGNQYTQFVAKDVTQLHENRVELQKENAHLRQVQEQLQQLSANIVAVTREEEILNTKMQVHDEMGRCLVAAQRYLREDCTESIPDTLAAAWQRAVSMIKYSNDTPEEDMLLQIRKTCAYVKLAYLQTGDLPREEVVAYLLTCAVRECVTNAVRYAQATELYVDFTESETEATVTVTNNGQIPDGEIVEGGGLSTLRRRIERAGGIMTVRSRPGFQLSVTLPKGKERVL